MKSFPLVLVTIILSEDAKILVMSGTHGTEEGVSALTDIEQNDPKEDYRFYLEDCHMVGIKAGPHMDKQRPPLSLREPFSEKDWMRLPDIPKPAEKMTPPLPNTLAYDDLMKKMDIRVAHITYYYKNGKRLIKDIKEECLIDE